MVLPILEAKFPNLIAAYNQQSKRIKRNKELTPKPLPLPIMPEHQIPEGSHSKRFFDRLKLFFGL